jgi:hypothetical protein
MHERYYDKDHKSSVRNGKIFLSADLVNSFQQYKKQEEEEISAR